MGIQSVCVKTGLLVERAATDVGTLFSDCCARTAGEGAAHVYGASDASSFCDGRARLSELSGRLRELLSGQQLNGFGKCSLNCS